MVTLIALTGLLGLDPQPIADLCQGVLRKFQGTYYLASETVLDVWLPGVHVATGSRGRTLVSEILESPKCLSMEELIDRFDHEWREGRSNKKQSWVVATVRRLSEVGVLCKDGVTKGVKWCLYPGFTNWAAIPENRRLFPSTASD